MSSPSSGSNNYEDIKERLAEIEDNLIVVAHLNTRMSNNLKQHAELFTEFDARMNRLAERDEMMDRRISDLVSAIGAFIAAQPQKQPK